MLRKLIVGSLGISSVALATTPLTLNIPTIDAIKGIERSASAGVTAAAIGLDYKYSLRKEPDFVSQYYRGQVDELTDEQKTEFAVWKSIREKIHTRCAKRILWLCRHNGGVFIKAGQSISAMNGAPRPYIDILSSLQDKAPFCSYQEIEGLFIDELGLKPADIFRSFDEIPIAAASLAQVHRAETIDGREVAVKIQYPRLKNMVGTDIITIQVLMNGLAYFFPNFEFKWIVPEFRTNIHKELNFEMEADNAEKIALLQNSPKVYIPKVYREYSSKRVMTMEFINGIKITDVKSLDEAGINRKQLMKDLVELFSDQIFKHGFVHCDPHPGNLLVRKGELGQTQIVLLDHGLYRELDTEFRKDYCKLWQALVTRDHTEIQRLVSRFGAGEHADLFTFMLTLKPSNASNIASTRELTKDEIKEIRKLFKKFHDDYARMLRDMSRNLLYVLRTTDLLRSINKELGDIDRFTIMARSSIQGLFHDPSSEVVSWRAKTWKSIGYYLARAKFELNLVLLPLFFWFKRDQAESLAAFANNH